MYLNIYSGKILLSVWKRLPIAARSSKACIVHAKSPAAGWAGLLVVFVVEVFCQLDKCSLLRRPPLLRTTRVVR